MGNAKCHPDRELARGGLCRECYLQFRRDSYHETYKERNRETYLLRAYGLTLDMYQQKLEDQGFVCAICKRPDGLGNLSIDHNHETGEVRGLLCRACNAAIGALGDDIVLLEKALEYLKIYG